MEGEREIVLGNTDISKQLFEMSDFKSQNKV